MNLRKFQTLTLAVLTLVTMSACGNQTAEAEATAGENSVTVTENENSSAQKTTVPTVTTTKATTEEPKMDVDFKNNNAKAWKNSIGSTYLMLIWEIENTGNVPIYFKSGTCEVVDANGGLIDIFQNVNVYPSIADPGECVYYYTTESFDIDEYTRAGMDDILIKPDGGIG
jgi:hypothetical protein